MQISLDNWNISANRPEPVVQAGAANASWDWERGNLSGKFTIPLIIQTHNICVTAYIRICVTYQEDYLTNDNIKIYVE